MGLGRRREVLAVLLARRHRELGPPRALGVRCDPCAVEWTRAGPQALEGVADAAVGGGVAVAVDAQVPLDPGLEGRARQVAAADERDAEVRRLEAPGLGVERRAARGQHVDLDHARSEAPGLGVVVVGLRRLFPVEQGLERGGLGDREVVAGDEADAGVATEGGIDGEPDAVEAGFLDERGDDRDVRGPIEERKDMAHERIVAAAGGERLDLAEVVALAGHDVAHTAARVVHVAAKPRDDVDVQVQHDGLAGGGAGVEAEL